VENIPKAFNRVGSNFNFQFFMEENTTSTQEQSVSQEQQTAKENNPTIIIQNSSKSNGIGTAGFVLALIAVFLGWVPVLGWIIWLLGLVLSGIGVTKTPKGLAIAGLVLSLIGLVILILLATVFATAAAVSSMPVQ